MAPICYAWTHWLLPTVLLPYSVVVHTPLHNSKEITYSYLLLRYIVFKTIIPTKVMHSGFSLGFGLDWTEAILIYTTDLINEIA